MGQPPTVDPDIRKLLPPLTPDELAGLEESILAEGIREPLLVWSGRNILVDGHNRLGIAQKHDLPYRVQEMSFSDVAEARQWVICNQLARRNLKPDAASYLRGTLKREAEIKRGRPAGNSGKNPELGPAETLANELGVDQSTLRKDARFAEAVDALADVAGEEVRDLVLSGDVPKQDTIRLANAAKDHPERAKAAIEKVINGEAENKLFPKIKPSTKSNSYSNDPYVRIESEVVLRLPHWTVLVEDELQACDGAWGRGIKRQKTRGPNKDACKAMMYERLGQRTFSL
jgi:ParB-like chromosome segregation protein Spo0J